MHRHSVRNASNRKQPAVPGARPAVFDHQIKDKRDRGHVDDPQAAGPAAKDGSGPRGLQKLRECLMVTPP
jgi:hypothetical protein